MERCTNSGRRPRMSDHSRNALEAAAKAAAGVIKIASGNPLAGVADLLDAALVIVPAADLAPHLSAAAKRRAEAQAAAIIAARFPSDAD